MAEFEVNGIAYRSGKMDAFSQLHVMRKLAPIFASVGSLSEVKDAMSGGGAVAAIAKAVSGMAEDDLNSVLIKCCSVTSRKVGEAGFAPIWNSNAGRMMYTDIEWLDLIQIVASVIQDNLGNFSAAPSLNLKG